MKNIGLIHFALGSGLLLLTAGCASHLHQPANHSLAQKAEQQFADLKKAHAATYEAMVTNHLYLSSVDSNNYKAMANREAQAVSRRVMVYKWGELRDQLSPANSRIQELHKKLSAQEASIKRGYKEVAGESKEALKILASTGEELEAAKATVTGWNRRVAVLDKLIETSPSVKQTLQNVKSSDDFKDKAQAHVAALKSALGEQTVVYIDADGQRQTNKLAKELTKMLDGKASSFESDSSPIVGVLNSAFSTKAPGLVITAASLARDLAAAESSRLSARMASLQVREKLLQDARRTLNYGADLEEEARGLLPAATFADADVIVASLKSKANANPAPTAEIADAMLGLANFVTVYSTITADVENALLKDAQEQHLESLKLSRIDLSQHEALVQRGLEGLSVYHAGGIKPEEIAEIAFQVAQTGLLAWIGLGAN